MSIKIGDKVRFLNDVGGGIVTKIIDKMMVMVENEFGFDVPTRVVDLVVIEKAVAYTEKAEQAPSSSNGEVPSVAAQVPDMETIFYPDVEELEESGNTINISLAFVPQGRPANSDLNVFLINDSNYNLLYSISTNDEHGTNTSNAAGVLEANTKEQTETIGMVSLNQIPEYTFQLVFYKKGDYKLQDPVNKHLKINSVKFFKERAFVENEFFNEPAIVYPIVGGNSMEEEMNKLKEKDLFKVIKEKEKATSKAKKVSKDSASELLEVDLHIHELLDDFRGLSNGEILEIQMDHFKNSLNDCQKNKIKKVVFIHGVGNGTLKLEIRKELDRMKKKLNYQDASFKEYGYGATLVKFY